LLGLYPIFYNPGHVQLADGDKATQNRDIQTALALAREL